MTYRILIVDDEPDWRTQFQEVMRLMKYEADAVENTSQAKEHLQDRQYDLLILDIGLDGTEAHLSFQTLCKHVLQGFPNLPIVATSGRPIDPTFMWELHRLGVIYFFAKSKVSADTLRGTETDGQTSVGQWARCS